MVVEPTVNTPRGKMQPGIAIHGRNFLRLIIAADYTDWDRRHCATETWDTSSRWLWANRH
jgi:hypothetical protein